ncbi:hypothetical protein DICSQDRAFT_182926 [Dichomitus squalens LYAD-421 SS1]|uniref:Fe2OG dioxygenase domain-containing protein n=1 Tax=Dichomitus squalens (strain LYAD-421) TaxID=732165 RepID=R7SNW4_DICSQ|nr:uncharacterized protein DICSQDRAFT_182926 [Dichomitus squalens LYAD-421 SS1]EJF57889.1 hypothetical protein DICSQDRAFT_182926 [Dichomitus squalens LYAD-421 SS1]
MPPRRKESKLANLTRNQLLYLKSTLVQKPPFCQGTLQLPDSDFTLFYGKEGNASRINLSTAPVAQLEHLAEACDPATFGVGGEDVHDETYRKAGKLDKNDFAIGFDINRSDLIDAIRSELLIENDRESDGEGIRTELYKLNVYGKGAFFKPHVDTPRSELMFGSLVIVFPPSHEGGALKLRAQGHKEGEIREWTFDSSALLAQQTHPSIAYIAFFSDIEHEVMPVTSGHRVTITYNLYHSNDKTLASSLPVLRPISTNEQAFRDALRGLIDSPMFLPDGGNLMFGLTHQYPLAKSYDSAAEAKQALKDLEPRLKATDGIILRVLRECSLDASLKIVYEARESQWSRMMSYVMFDGVIELPSVDHMIRGTAPDYLESEGGQHIATAGVRVDDTSPRTLPVHWVTDHPLVPVKHFFKETIKAYGNEPTLEVVYWRIWIFVRVGPKGQRGVAGGS